jgi:hypothetical protein
MVSSWIKEVEGDGEQDEVVNPLDDENLFIERGPPAKRSFFDSLAAIASSSIVAFISKLFLICSFKAILCPKGPAMTRNYVYIVKKLVLTRSWIR